MDFNKMNIFFRCGKEYGRNAIKDLGINDTEYTICSFLYFYKDAPQDLICKSYMIDKTTVTKALHSMEERGLITRTVNPENRRQNLINLTNDGKDLIKDVVNVYDEWVSKVAASLDEDEQKQFEIIMNKLLTKAKELKDETAN